MQIPAPHYHPCPSSQPFCNRPSDPTAGRTPTKEDLKAIQLPVTKKLGEGGCGVVYEVSNAKTPHVRAALKSEPFGMHEDDELLKMEVHVLRKLPNGRHVCRLLATGKGTNFTFVVMTLLGPALNDLRRQCPERRFSVGTTVLLGVECVEAVRELHEAGFVHRDVKPSNSPLGRPPKQRVVFLYDFGLARQILGVEKLREPRRTVSFKGTVRYASLNAPPRGKPNERTKATDLKRVYDNCTKCEVTEIGEREFARPTEEDTGTASHISGVSANDDTLFNVQQIH
ncbi:CK1/TTBK protein kinase [Aphelenchoides fujianensis]|nr:CK1/TTBK protein kinase [Aphelenchoides fujianensis]